MVKGVEVALNLLLCKSNHVINHRLQYCRKLQLAGAMGLSALPLLVFILHPLHFAAGQGVLVFQERTPKERNIQRARGPQMDLLSSNLKDRREPVHLQRCLESGSSRTRQPW